MFEYDICFCGNNKKCPNRENCRRAVEKPAGIYTISLFYKENEDCEYYYPIKEENK